LVWVDVGEEGGEVFIGMGGDAGEDVAEIGEGVDIEG
jgi:hypothetical protein